MMSEATVTSEESAYRAKYYKSVTSVSKQEVFCSSCGNIISNHNYHAHPILEILQCQACSDVFRGLTSRVKGKAWKKRCLMCGSDQCQTLFPCPVKDCPYSFCKNCIKRNAASALLVADMKNWKCFVCRTNPLWEARGICVTLMSASSRRRKKLKTVREESSEDDDFDDIKTQMLSKKTSRVSRVSESKSSSNVRRRRPLRNSSKSGVNEIHEESDNDIEMVSVVKLAKSSQQRTTKTLNRKDSPERSSVERNTTPEPSGHQSKSAFPISRRKIRAGSTDSKKGTQKFTQHLEKFKRQNSDSSSGKEFTQKKIIRESYVTLQRLSTLEQDFTHSPDETDSPQGMVLSNQQIFSLKCSIQDFIHNLKSASKKMIEAADSLQRQYSQKETIRPAEATKWIVECKSTVASFKKKIDDNEHTLVNKFGSWCKKTKIKNIFISANGIDESVTPSRTDLHDRGKRRGIVPSSSDDDEKETTDDRKTSSMSKTPEVSDCESAEIFTQDEEAHSSKTKSKSRRQSRTDKILSPVDEEMNGDTSDAEHRESSLRSSSVVSDVIVEANSSKITGTDAEKSSNDDMFADSEDERKSRKTERQGKTEKIRQQEELSDSANAQEEVFVPGPKCSKKSRKSIEKVGSITSREKSSDSLLLCEDENDEKNNDKKKNKRATLSVTDSEDDQKSKRKPRTKSLKSSEGKKKTESQENKENRGKPPSLMDSDTSADEAKRKKSKAVRNRSKGQSRISSDNEKISRSDNKKKKMKGSTPISSDVDASNDDGKLVQPVEEKSDTVEMTNEPSSHQPEYSSEQDLRMDLSDTPEKNEKPSAVGEDNNAHSAAVPADANTVEANKSKDKSGNEGKKKKKKSQEKKPLSSGVSDGEINRLGLSSDCSFVTIEEPSSPGDTSSKRNDPVAEAPDDTELAINTSPNSITSEIPTIALDQSESGEKDPDEAEKQAKANLLESSSDSEDEDEDEISELLVEKSKERLKESESKEDSGTEKPPEESEVDDKSKRKDSAKLATHDDVAMEVVNERAGSSNEDEVVALDKAEKSIEERPSDCERKAKEALLNSDSSSDDDQTEESPEKSSSTGVQIEETTKDSLLEPDTSSDKISDDTASKGQKKEALASSLPVNGPGTSNTKETDEISQKSGDEVEHSDKNSDGPKENEKSQSGSSIAGKPLDPKLSSESKKLGNNTMRDIMEEMEILSDQEDAEGDSKELKLPLKKPAHAKDEDSDSTASSTPRVKKRKLSIRNSEFYKNDKKLRMKCSVVVNRLSNSILRRHARALKKSKEYLEDKKFKSLTALDGLERSRKRQKGNTSDVSDTSIIRSKKKTLKEAEDTLVDHLNVNGEKINPDDSSSSDQDTENHEKSQPSGDLQYNAERLAKSTLMESSDDDKAAELSSDDESVKESTQKSDQSKEKPSTSASTSSKSSKADWKKSKLLTMKLSSSDEDEKSRKFDKKVQRLSQKDSDNSDFQDDTKKKKKVRRRRLNSDSDVKLTDEEPSNDSDGPIKSSKAEKKGKKRSKKTDNSSDSSESLKSKRPKPKRRRVRTAGTDSDSDAEDIPNSQGSPNKSGRKNIRRVIKDTKVADDTKQAAKQEEERLKRMAERQKLYNEMYEARLAGEEKVDKLILDFDEESKEILLSVNEGLVKRLKPHQAQGIKFMWDACFESLERAKSTSGSGCILAHCMGLGKSFQAVTLTHTVLVNSEKTGVRTVLVVCPLSTVLNWVNEFKIWLNEVNDGDDVEVYELTKFKQNNERRFQLERWQRTGGVIILGYEMYRNLSNPPKKVNKKVRESFFKCLVEPGPDLVICDEGHLLKSETTALSKAMSKIKTLRRIVLTGTPLQNNLTEYHCMVQFVKPNLLGTKKEFLNRFVNPIQNGQFDNSTEYDVKLMKKRAHVLHKMLEGSVQRFDYSVLTPFLPPKQEYVIFVELSDIQIKLYQYYIDNLARKHRGVGGSLFADFQALQRIWTHPIAIKLNADKAAEKKTRELSDSEGSLRDFIDDNSDEDSSDSISTIGSADSSKSKKSDVVVKRHTRGNPDEDEVVIEEPPQEQEWWTQFVQEEHFEDIRISAKLRILFEILKESENIGDKVLVFSQSLYSLTLIERFLAMIDDATHNNSDKPSELFDNHTGSWSLGLDYFRLDGQTTTENRSLWCKIFNRPTNTRARLFLISTRAGGLGINLTAANRVVIFDASWNPSHDVQSIFRIYRFGQKKPCYVYRLLAAGTMEEKIYNRQVTKLSLSCRVVDEQQIERHYTHSDLAELYTLDSPPERPEIIGCPKDRLLAEIFSKYKDIVINFHEHDSLLENKADEELDEEERKQAWLEYEQEKAGKPPAHQMMNMGFNYQDQMAQYNQQVVNTLANGNNMHMELLNLQKLYAKDFPNMSPEQQKMMATKALMDMYNYMETQAVLSSRVAPQLMGTPTPSYSNPTNTLANQLAQEAYTRHHQQAKQMTAYQKQLLYAQQFGNFKSIAGGLQITPQNSNMYGQQTAMAGMAAASSDGDVIEVIPNPTPSNSTAQSSSAQNKPSKYQEE